MLPVLLQIRVGGFSVTVQSYGACIVVGAVAALWIAIRRTPEVQLDPRSLLKALTIATVGGLLGSRLTFLIQCGGPVLSAGLVLWGGIVFGLAALVAACAWLRLPVLRTADLIMPCALLALAFGRIGCTLAGCCYGTPWDSGLVYPRGSIAHAGQIADGTVAPWAAYPAAVLPIQLMECAALILIAAGASLLWRRRPAPGVTLAAAALAYALWRFGAEFWRADHRGWWAGGLTFSQGISLAAGTIAIVFLFCRGGASWERGVQRAS